MPHPATFNTVLGYAPGNVPVFSSHYPSADETQFPNRKSFRSYVDGLFMGYKWQCVEFARRWLYLNHGWVFDNVPMAYDIFHLRTLRSVTKNEVLPLRSFRNGVPRHPEPGCLLIWQEGGEFEETGHVAVVTEVFHDRIRIAEQNVDHLPWPEGRNYSRELPAYVDERGGYHIQCSYDDADILGWVVQTDEEAHAENFSPLDRCLFNIPAGELANPATTVDTSTLTLPEDKAYISAVGGFWLTANNSFASRYLRMGESALGEIRHASNELHAMFMHATDTVLEDDELLSRFGFPPPLWPRIRRSWNNRRNHLITGRLDFSVSDRGIKLYEYNADSASCYMECGRVQGIWSSLHGCEEGWDPGHHLHEALVHSWRKSHIEGVLHIMQDNDKEETYHARFMQSAMAEAGITTKVIRGLNALRWNDQGQVVDSEGERILQVWKTWAWETALDQLREECSEDDEPQLPDMAARSKHFSPRLVDVLLTPEVKVFEPLWSLVPSNKAILPVLYEMYSDHPCLLNTQFELTPELQSNGHVVKPIVGDVAPTLASLINETMWLKRPQGSSTTAT